MRWLTAGVVLGVGLGGFADGILLHQIVQWHNMGSAVVPPVTMDAMKLNMTWDGMFHLFTWGVTLAGVFMLWSAAQARELPASAGALAGEMLFGWGAFNLIEGIVDHHLLNLHHVRDLPAHVQVYDWAFLAVGGVAFLAVGWMLMRPAAPRISA